MEMITAIGFAAATLTTFSGLPQLIRLIKVRETRDISLEMYLMICSGIALWLVYGLMKNDIVIISANSLSLVFTSGILFMKLKYK